MEKLREQCLNNQHQHQQSSPMPNTLKANLTDRGQWGKLEMIKKLDRVNCANSALKTVQNGEK